VCINAALFPSLFNVFMDAFNVKLRSLGHSCTVSDYYLGCILYADDYHTFCICIWFTEHINFCNTVSGDILLSFSVVSSAVLL